jgi:hypothetical protein
MKKLRTLSCEYVCVITVQRYVEYYLFSKVLVYFQELRLSLLRVIVCLF